MIQAWTPPCEKGRSPALRNGICSPTNKMLGCRLLAHCGNRRTINSAMVFMPLGQGSCPTLNFTASENRFTIQKASPAFFVKERL